jgi:hypothetical protein
MPEPELLPIYDASAPIVCTIAHADVPERLALVGRMRAAATRIERTPHGLVLHFPHDPEVLADLHAFAVGEKGCCGFWGFEIVDRGDEVALRWDGPPAVDELFTRLERYFSGDGSIDLLDGLL